MLYCLSVHKLVSNSHLCQALHEVLRLGEYNVEQDSSLSLGHVVG